jgi:pyruvate/2-oxoglutarate dehydrogenase complex dihydrolipoamide acyltransferase (E2) component
LKKEGDSIKPGDILAQIETDKATVDFEMQEEGYIAKLLFAEGAKDVKLGTVVAIVVDSKDDIAKFKDYTGGDASKAAAPAAPAAQPPVSGGGGTPPPAIPGANPTSLINFEGGNTGNKTNFDALGGGVRTAFMDMVAAYGKPVKVTSAKTNPDDQKRLYDLWVANGGGPSQPTVSAPGVGRITTPVKPGLPTVS